MSTSVTTHAMRIHAHLFAALRERAGVAALSVDLPAGSTVADAAEAIAVQLPSLRGFATRTAYAVNRCYVKPMTVLYDGDELALIPPVSGG
jgi:molybdopterin converting factor subunit 1